MCIETLKCIDHSDLQISFIGARGLYKNFHAPRSICIFIVLLFFGLSLSSVSTNYISGHEYVFNFDYNENYIYQWNASSGDYQENDTNTIAWRAPEVNAPTEVTISVLVTDKTCSCQSIDSKMVTVLPNEETKTNLSNSTNSTKFDNNTKIVIISTNLTQNSTIPIQKGNDTAASEYPENLTAKENLTLGAEIENEPTLSDLDQNETETHANVPESNPEQDLAPIGYENGTTTKSQQILDTNANQMIDEIDLGVTADNPSVTESAIDAAKQEDQKRILEFSTLSFSDGTKIDVAFVEGSTESSATFVKLHQDNTVWNEIISGSADSNNADPFHNTTSISNSTINQTDDRINQIKPTEAILKDESNDHSNEVASEYSEKGEDPSNTTESLEVPANQTITEAKVSDAVEISASPPLPVEATSDPEQETPAFESQIR